MKVTFNLCTSHTNMRLGGQIGIKSDWREAQAKMVLFLGNKHTASLANVRVLILPAPHLKMQFSQVPDTIPPRAQVGLYSSLKIADNSSLVQKVW